MAREKGFDRGGSTLLSREGVGQIAGALPRTVSDLLKVDGMTEAKWRDFGARIMAVLEPFWDEVDRVEEDRIAADLRKLENKTDAYRARSVLDSSYIPASAGTFKPPFKVRHPPDIVH